MRRDIFFLVVGAILGVVASLIGHPFSVAEDEYTVTSPATALRSKSKKHRIESGDSVVVDPSNSGINSADVENNEGQLQPAVLVGGMSANERGQIVLSSPVPELYDTMLKPRELPKSLRTAELYERFMGDARDNAWADAMELGINQYIAERGSDLEVVFDFVECRSRYCVVAGVSYSQDRGPWNTFNPEMRNSGWWLASGGDSTVGGTYGSETRFATVISRERSDTVRPGSEDNPSNKSDENGTQSAKVGMASR